MRRIWSSNLSNSNIYTRTGDDGETGLFGGGRVPKDDPRLEAYGTVDELNTLLGVISSVLDYQDIRAYIETIQSQLFDIGGELATPDLKERIAAEQPVGPRVTDEDVTTLETWIDHLDQELSPLQNFILPGGHTAAAHLQHARTVCRRAERRIVTLEKELTASSILRYLNRLSDLLFVMSRTVNARVDISEPQWKGLGER
tara:strand:+ start:6362 stop:6961 length:600 start_codon:yes stop_codon:yes gene_type:complete